MTVWDPTRYLEFADERSRPFYELVSRVGADRPRLVVDLGCGPGQLTVSLAGRWPETKIIGVDSSQEMIMKAQQVGSVSTDRNRVIFELGDLERWTAPEPVDVIISNAALQWVPGHRDLLPHLVEQLAPGGWLAFQVPGNFDAPSHRLLHALAAEAPYAEHTAGTQRVAAAGAADYLDDLAGLGCSVDAWETTYLHVLPGPDAVFRWISGTGARPVLQALPEELRPAFETTYRARLREAYPEQEFGTVLPFRRVFVVARRPGGDR